MSAGVPVPRAPAAPTPSGQPIADDRLLRQSLLRRLVARPELGAVAGAIAVWIFFAIVAGGSGWLTAKGTAAYMQVAGELGILEVPVSLLMIAGDVDISIWHLLG